MLEPRWSILIVWWADLYSLLSDSENRKPGDHTPETLIVNQGKTFHNPTMTKFQLEFADSKSNKLAGTFGLPADLFKHDVEELRRYMHKQLCKIWLVEACSTLGNSALCSALPIP